jgi:hypothetical protein
MTTLGLRRLLLAIRMANCVTAIVSGCQTGSSGMIIRLHETAGEHGRVLDGHRRARWVRVQGVDSRPTMDSCPLRS